jgi:hypothetical protein
MQVDWIFVWSTFKPFALFVIGMVLYALFVLTFYKWISKKFVFDVEWKDYKWSKHPGLLKFFSRIGYSLKYVLFSPFLFFLWGGVITLLLFLFTGTNPVPVETTLLISMSLLATIRVTAYIQSELAGELAKTLPLAVLAVFLLDMSSINLSAFLTKVGSLPQHFHLIIMYFLFVVLLELILRLVDGMLKHE